MIAALGLGAYANSLFHPFIFDDLGAISLNPQIRQIDFSSVLAPAIETPLAGRPVVTLSLAINYALQSGTDGRGDIFVARAGRTYQELAKNSMKEVMMGTPAISNGLIVIRTLGDVYGVGEK